jgi:hypothetical protein
MEVERQEEEQALPCRTAASTETETEQEQTRQADKLKRNLKEKDGKGTLDQAATRTGMASPSRNGSRTTRRVVFAR